MLPSVVVAAIDRAFPQAVQESQGQGEVTLQLTDAMRLRAIADLVEAVPADLITVSEDRYAALRMALGAIRGALDIWHARGGVMMLRDTPGVGSKNPVTVLREILAQCSDTPLAQRRGSLKFIRQRDLRETLLKDIAEAEGAFAGGEWKAATVLAGSVVEALLLWAVNKLPPTARSSAVAASLGSGSIKKAPKGNPEDWVLSELIAVAGAAKIIKDDTIRQADQARDFRNLIHPGRAQRLGQQANRGTTLAALAAVEFVVRDLT